MPGRPAGEPVTDQRGLVARRIVRDDVDVEIGGHILLHRIEEAAELVGAVARHALADDGAGLHIQRSKQRGRAVALIVVSAPLGLPRPQGQQRLGAIQRLDLRLFIDAKHQCTIRRVEIEADDFPHLLDEQRIGGQLEGFAAMRLERERSPDAMHRRDRQTRGPRHRARAPVRRGARHRLQGGRHHLGNLVVADLARRARPGFVKQPIQTPGRKPLAPACHRDPRRAEPLGDCQIGQAFVRQQHDLRPNRIAARRLAASHPRLKLRPLTISQLDPDRAASRHLRQSPILRQEYRIRAHIICLEISGTEY